MSVAEASAQVKSLRFLQKACGTKAPFSRMRFLGCWQSGSEHLSDEVLAHDKKRGDGIRTIITKVPAFVRLSSLFASSRGTRIYVGVSGGYQDIGQQERHTSFAMRRVVKGLLFACRYIADGHEIWPSNQRPHIPG